MEQAELEQIRNQTEAEIRRRFPGAPIQRVEVLQYGDDPEIEPGQLVTRVYIESPADEAEAGAALEAFHDAHRAALEQLRHDLAKPPALASVDFLAGAESGREKRRVLRMHSPTATAPCVGAPLTPVMARLGTDDLQTLDTLIAAGIASSRSEGVRWALARIRNRPAYEQLRARAREIEELKSQF